MKEILKRLRSRGKQLTRNRLFTDWLKSDGPSPREKFLFSPMALDFVMGFRDFNKYYVRYESPQNELEAALNHHASEDETHSGLLLHDWKTLDLDERLGWAPRDMFWWLTGDATKASRKADFELMKMVYENPDPLVRFAIIEAMEAAGNIFFSRTVPIIDVICEGGDQSAFPYYGKFHFDRENGHLQNASERDFFQATMTDAQRTHALALVDRVFDIFEFHFDTWHEYAKAVYEGRYVFDAAAESRAVATIQGDRPQDLTRYLHFEYPAEPAAGWAELVPLRRHAIDQLWRSPGYSWMRTVWPEDFRRMTRYFLLQWVVDNWACADYFAFDTTYETPTTPLERGINRLSTLYASEMNRRYAEWETLQLDEYTGWSASEALQHYWLDERVELHRKVFADLRKLTMKYPKPLHRYWIMKCFVRFGDTMMQSLGVAMGTSMEPGDNFVTFAGEPERLHPKLPSDPAADAAIALLELSELSPEDVAILRTITEETFAQEAERSAITWQIVTERRFRALDERWQSRIRTRPKAVAIQRPATQQTT